MKHLAELFNQEPIQWGFRGDPFLWRDMRREFVQTPIPESVEELDRIIHEKFEHLTGSSINSIEIIKVEKYNFGGMSGGGISTVFWKERGLPLLRSRLMDLL